jgi:hypothetical protein
MTQKTTNGLSHEEALHLQRIENNPLNAEQVAMFAKFEAEGWSKEKRLAHLRKRAEEAALVLAAE